MQVGALAPYERALRTGGRLGLVDSLGRRHRLDVDRWVGVLDRADESVLRRCHGPVLDVGCGPGRFGAALARHGIPALGIDIAPGAVRAARRRGAHAVCRDLFDTDHTAGAGLRPEPTGWRTVLLLDGNIGIGGDPRAVLVRAAELLAPGGEVIVEADGSPLAAAAVGGEELLRARFVDRSGRHEPIFDWALVGPAAVRRHARSAGLEVAESWTVRARPFLRLTGR
jgi:SAM-dependent methyltransferase